MLRAGDGDGEIRRLRAGGLRLSLSRGRLSLGGVTEGERGLLLEGGGGEREIERDGERRRLGGGERSLRGPPRPGEGDLRRGGERYLRGGGEREMPLEGGVGDLRRGVGDRDMRRRPRSPQPPSRGRPPPRSSS